ncbi:OLC1v1010259C1 [Oldenlandia corymbosa var. corymbosa]|uniref:Nicastrin n=1 Tax=Oldenlandia corymbosa var. corymbosa TaxID=529605 RepID=A0AAV1DQW5_OLDCO|nr:OLC1v1010259C1 [Oldenlandia corymbosa var. corymbosa]
MDMRLPLVLFYFIAHLLLTSSASGDVKPFESVPDLENAMYMNVDGYPCVRLLNLSGEIGCSNPGHAKVAAPVVRFKNVNELAVPSAILVSMDEFENLFTRISKDSKFAGLVAGVLVESGTPDLKGFSPDRKFPEAEFAPYSSNNFEWNPTGSGIMWNAYNFPVFLLSENSSLALQEVAMKNEKRSKSSYTANVAEFGLVMQTTKAGTHDSESCLRENTCLPLGGYSVWSSLQPFNSSSSVKSKPIILAIASMDAASFFRDTSFGAESPISGFIALLAAVDALSRVDGLHLLSKQIVFMVFTGEAWGFIGSRRFLLELDLHSDAVNGLDLSLIDMVVEIGSVGKSAGQGVKTFFAHTTGAASTSTDAWDALQHAQISLKTENIKISKASKSNPGIPPSSLMMFLRKNPQLSGIVVEDFDSAFANKFYHSHLDNISNINRSAVVAAASLVARSLYIFAREKEEINDTGLYSITVNASLVDELLGCLLKCEPGFSCELVKRYISPSTACPSHYVGVMQGEPSSSPYLEYVGDVSRFVWNFLAEKTSMPSKNSSSTCPKDCSGTGEVCIRVETDGKGVCVMSSTRYVPAYSTRLKFEEDSWKLLPNNSDVTGAADPVWTESNWDTITLRVYTTQDSAYDRLILMLGIIVTLMAYVAILVTRSFIRKALKRE